MIYLDFETYSEAGYAPKEGGGWTYLPGAREYGIDAVGAAVYAQHPSTEILSMAYAIDYGDAVLWTPEMPPPNDLFRAMEREDEEIEAWYDAFEVWIWEEVAVPKYGWPPLPIHKVRDSMARAKAYSLPGSLAEAGRVLNLDIQKDKDGSRLLKLYSSPRQPTKTDPSTRNLLSKNPVDAEALYRYNRQDVHAERAIVDRLPKIEGAELEWWRVQQYCNRRGVRVDMPLVRGAKQIINRLTVQAQHELLDLTHGEVDAPTKLAAMSRWLHGRGVILPSMDEDAVAEALKKSIPEDCRRVLEIRKNLGSAAVKKFSAIDRQAARGDRLHDLFIYHGAHTGRETGVGPQPQNLPNSGPNVKLCQSCQHWFGAGILRCPHCASLAGPQEEEWNPKAAEEAIASATSGDVDALEKRFGSAFAALSACLRGVFIASPGHVMVGADFSSIEGVGAAMLTEEKWRIDVFRTHGKIYEMAGAKMLGTTLEKVLAYKEEKGHHHPIRKRAKVGELAGGYGGSVGAWLAFGAADYFENEEAIREAVNAWRNDSPMFPLTWYAMHDSFVQALLNPGTPISPRRMRRGGETMGNVPGVTLQYYQSHDVLRMRLPSGRHMTYHRPRLEAEEYGRPGLSFEGWNTNLKNGGYGWIRKRTFGGRLFENLVQAACRDLLTHAAVNAHRAGFELCLHVHDELCCEVPMDLYPLANEQLLKAVMMDVPDWARDWPVRAAGEWSGFRYQK